MGGKGTAKKVEPKNVNLKPKKREQAKDAQLLEKWALLDVVVFETEQTIYACPLQ